MSKKKILNLTYILLTLTVIVIFAFMDHEIKDIWKTIEKLNLNWLICGFIFMICFWLMDSIILRYSVMSMFKKISLFKAIKIALIGQYYNAVTPFSSGGQPVQAYYLMKHGIPIGIASSILTMKFLAYQSVLSFFCLIAMLLKSQIVIANGIQIFWFSLIGFIVHIAAIFLVVLLMVNQTFVVRAVVLLIRLGSKFKLIRQREKTEVSVTEHLDDFVKSAVFMAKNPVKLFTLCLLTLCQLIFYFGITYFIYRSIGLQQHSIIDIIAIQSFLYLAVSLFPTPGGTGASEGGFYIFFNLIFPKDVLFVSMLIWRLITYYSNIIIGGLFVLVDSVSNFRESDKV